VTPPGWPFFAPAELEAIERALDLADLQEGEHFVDLGCGDGGVLVAAARRGAWVTGVECDPDLADQARQALAREDLDDHAAVVVGDLFQPDLLGDAVPDVLFSYLSPATIQRLVPALRHLDGARLVTVDFTTPDLVPDATAGASHLYHLPGEWRPSERKRVGWPSDGAGTLCIAAAEVSSLTCLTPVHRGGPVRVSLSGEVARHAEVAAGADDADRGRPIAVDIRWKPRDPGTLATGALCLDGLEPHPLTVLFTESDHGQWNLTPAGNTALTTRLTHPDLPPPTHAADLLDFL
jgi:SAM-dependent methyltransferase